ncbi:TonB-dependent receptor [Dasania marina]|uniref:TonB-dependent receptor n=1 Tax=Dasania marina TaxID=471499 RepID=UPI00036D3C30|nr:TonB-dependent receptor plug domain-containing protein [Dasania marina]
MTINSYLAHNNRMYKLIAAIGLASLSTTATAATLEEVVVTAQKRSESLQDVGAAVSAMTSDDLNRLNIKSGRDLFDRLPNISLQTNASESQAQVSMRGLSFSTFNLNAVQPVGLFQDEINLNSPQASGLFLFDLERIEVVRGPQNTLYGRNTTGGAVNFISKRPKVGSGTTGDIAVTYGRFNQLDFDAAVGFDLGDTAAARIAVNSRDRDGIFDNKFTGDDDSEQDKKAIRAQLVWEPSDETEILFNYHWGQVDADSRRIKTIGLLDPNNIDASTVDFKNGLTGNCPLPGKGDLGSGCVSANWAGDQGYADTDDFDISADLTSPIDKITDWGSFLNITHDFSSFTLTSITGYKENEFRFAHDDDASPFTVYSL